MHAPRFGLALVVALLSLGAAAGQSYPLKIKTARVGFPPAGYVAGNYRDDDGAASHIVKTNTWAPVYLELEVLREVKGEASIVLEASDPDDLGTAIAVPLQNLSDVRPGTLLRAEELAYVPCVRLAGHDLTITIREREPAGGNPTAGRSMAEPKRMDYVRTRDTAAYVVLALGSKLAAFDLPTTGKGGEVKATRAEVGYIDNPFLLPDHWRGYDGADLVVLATGSASVQNFLTPLFTAPQHKPRLDALVEWVRRGGRLVVSVGSNAAIVSNYPVLQELLPMQVRKENPTEQVGDLFLEWVIGSRDSASQFVTLAPKSGTFPVANLVPHAARGYRQVVPRVGSSRPNARPTVVQAPYGLGRVTLVAFDLDRSPFVDYEERAKFWDSILRECGSERATQSFGKNNNYNSYYGVSEDELSTEIRQHTDSFASVPVISFGWVAIFIVLYTLLIGPVEYYVLKKVFKRLELTWITFPIIVLTVSAVAYFSAYALKGSDMKVNKVDLLDIDPATNRVYGRTWFTIFSPRIDTYKIGVEPNDKWVSATNGQPDGGATLDWTGAGSGRKGSFFRRSYHYQQSPPGDAAIGTYADGLVNVPIQVWSTKAFMAQWSGPIDRQAPLVAADLSHPPAQAENVGGKFTLNLPFKELQDVYLIYAGKAYKWDPISSGVPVNVFLDPAKVDNDWLTKLSALSSFVTAAGGPRGGGGQKTSTGVAPIFNLMFHDEAQKFNDTLAPRNATLRRVDQSWRFSALHRDEVIVVGRVPMVRDAQAEGLLTEADSPSPTKLWLKDLPGPGKKRDAQQGTLQQETYVRIYVPVKPVKK